MINGYLVHWDSSTEEPETASMAAVIPETAVLGLTTAAQVFGGCCSNVLVLERLLQLNSLQYSLSTLVTWAQFVFVSAVAYRSNVDVAKGRWQTLWLQKPAIPVHKWALLVVMYFTLSFLNNWVLKFNVSIPLHIVFRSSSTVITMLVGWLFGGKRYSRGQVMASITISLGTVLATVQNAASLDEKGPLDKTFVAGVLILVGSAVLSAFMGLYNEQLFAEYGGRWQESLFYTHFLALPLFALGAPTLLAEMRVIWGSPESVCILGVHFPTQMLNLAMNVVSQYVCIRGVNKLASRSSALTVTVVLLGRKFASLMLSVVLFGNEMSVSTMSGAAFVFVGVLQYGMARKGGNMKEDENERKKSEEKPREQKGGPYDAITEKEATGGSRQSHFSVEGLLQRAQRKQS